MLGSLEPFASVLFKHMPIWLKLINGKKSVIREGALDLILHFPWETEANLSNWIGVFREVGQTRELKRSPEEKRRLTLLVGKLHECNRQESQHTEAHEQLKSYLAALDNENYYQRLKALRNLNAQFREAMISNNPEGFDQLSRAIETLMTENEEHLEVLIQLFHLCAKLKDPLLLKQVKRMAEEGPGPIATAAQRFIQVAATQRPPIREIRKILLLDDSRYICNQLAHFLCEQGFKAQGSTDPFAAMDLLEQESFDLLLLDYRMPEMDGLSFLTEIRRRLLRPRFTVIVTSERDREVMLQFAEQQINGILFKPFKMDKLLEKIQMLTMTEEPNP
jgi:CheY-like chemotaxis protein